MANVTVAGASYSDVPAVALPTTGGGTSTFYEADFKTVTQTLTSVTSSNDDTRVENGASFFTELTPASGYYISSITVTMGGVDITDQVFKPGTGAKSITANGTYAASADGLSGYTAVSVNVPSGSASLGTKSITSNGTYNASSDGYDGYSQVTVNVSGGITPTGTKNISITSNGTTTEDVTNYATASITANVPNSYTASDEGKVVSNGALVSQTSDTVTTNGTVDTTLINSLTVSVPTSGGIKYKTGSYTPTQDYKTTTNVLITSLANIGFTPTKFIFMVKDKSDVSGIQYAILQNTYVNDGTHSLRNVIRYSNTSNTLSTAANSSSWTTQTNYYLYCNGTNVYIRTTSAFILKQNVEYLWYAYE